MVGADERDVRCGFVGAQRQRPGAGPLQCRQRQPALLPVLEHLERAAFPVFARGPAAPLCRRARIRPRQQPRRPAGGSPVPGRGHGLCQPFPVRDAVLPADRVLRHACASARQRVVRDRQSLFQSGRRVQSRELGPDVHRVRELTVHLQLGLGVPEICRQPQLQRMLERRYDQHRGVPRCRNAPDGAGDAVLAAGRREPERARVGHAGNPTGRIGVLHPGHLEARSALDAQLWVAVGGPSGARPDHAPEPGLLCAVHRENRHEYHGNVRLPLRRHDSV